MNRTKVRDSYFPMGLATPECAFAQTIRGSHDIHTHTQWSDGSDTVWDIVKLGEQRVGTLAITDHFRPMTYARKGVKEEHLARYAAEIRRIDEETASKLLVGLEITCPRTEAERRLLARITRNTGLEVLLVEYVHDLNDIRSLASIRLSFPELLIGLAHPTLDMRRDELGGFADAIESWGFFVELNESKLLYEVHRSRYAFLAQRTRVFFGLGSDSHDGVSVGVTPTAYRFLYEHQALDRLI
jgi:histidinol phosphatase-like PHP family hydrolase